VGRIPDHLIHEVRARADLVALVSRHVSLRQVGARHWGLCPFHQEKTPSFHVNSERQIFYCFGCHTGGDVFGFRMRVEGLEFPEAVRVTAQEVGVQIRDSVGGPPGQSSRLVRANEVALAFFRKTLRGQEGVSARRYLEGRGIPADLIERFEIGYAPPLWDGVLEALHRAGIPEELGEQVGLLAPRQTGDGWYDRFRDRVVFPIRSAGGRLLGFGGRALDPSAPKYLNTPETPLYRKAEVVFGLPQSIDGLRHRSRAVVVEGYFDVLALERAGLHEGVAPCGTALTQEQARRLRRYVPEVVLVFDGDDAGRSAAERALPLLLREELRVRAVFLPPGEDPDTMVSGGNAEALRSAVETATPLLDQLIEEALKSHDGRAWSAADAVRGLAPYLLALVDPVEREASARKLAAGFDLSPTAVLAAARRHASGPEGQGAQNASPVPDRASIDPITRTLVGILVAEPGLAGRVTESHIHALPSREAQELVRRLLAAIRSHGDQALAHLLSPAEADLGPDLKGMLSQIVSESVPMEGSTAERALWDCLARLEHRALDRESQEINTRLETCGDPEEERTLLEAKQKMLSKRRILRREERPV
jgi:DNA primase